MSQPIIQVSGISKRYQLGRIGFTSLREEFGRWWQRGAPRDESRDFWALREVSFDVAPGEVVGLIGRNGAGKSTLLKILSEITEPTTGEIRMRGHVASLLEVGTGFHPELSGRENIFLNGATLGMRRAEIRRKFDEIVAFAEVDKFIDTPVKRYSSGMYVRLAFAVAAHLEPEILIIDEVLAVGDQAFQQKCLGKMQDVARNDGRTVLFVSHNMAAVNRLCHRAIHLIAGRVTANGPAAEVVAGYLQQNTSACAEWHRPPDAERRGPVSFLRGCVRDQAGSMVAVLPHTEPFSIELECDASVAAVSPWVLRVSIYDNQGHELFSTHDTEAGAPRPPRPGQKLRAVCTFQGGMLKPGTYFVGVSACELAGDAPVVLYEEYEPLLSFEVSAQGYVGQAGRGLLGPRPDWVFAPVA